MNWTEADFLVSEAGIPTVIFGPGESGEAHSTHESVAVSQIERAARIDLDIVMG